MKTLTKIIAGAGIFAGLVGGVYLNDQGNLSEKPNLVYQGHHVNNVDGYNLLIFDDKALKDRTTAPDLSVIGNPDGLETGTEYDVNVRSPRWIGLDKVDSIERSD